MSYRPILEHFESIRKFRPSDFIVAAHIVYGWMPTALELAIESDEDLNTATDLLNAARAHDIADEGLRTLVRIVNNSLVGASKLLHFAAADRYAIWDSRVYEFFRERRPYHFRMNSIPDFREYHRTLELIRSDPRFDSFRSSVCAKLGYSVSGLRAIELVMFLSPR